MDRRSPSASAARSIRKMERRSRRCFIWRMTGCIRQSAKGATAWSSLLQLGDQPVDNPRERGHLPLRYILTELRTPLLIKRPELLHHRPPTATQLHARRAQIIRIVVTFREAQLLEPRDHAGH